MVFFSRRLCKTELVRRLHEALFICAKIGYVSVTKRVQNEQNFKYCKNRIRLCYKTCPKTAKFQILQKSDTLVLQNLSKFIPKKFKHEIAPADFAVNRSALPFLSALLTAHHGRCCMVFKRCIAPPCI